ncbi:MAG: acyl-CoA thioesterase [Allosphingosinicella sp.]
MSGEAIKAEDDGLGQDFRLIHQFRVRYAEIDAQSVVFNSRYLEYADIVLTEYMRSVGLPLDGPDAWQIHVVHAEVQYRQPLRFDDVVNGWARVARIGRSSIRFEVELRLAGENAAKAGVGLTYVHVDLETGRSTEITENVRRLLLHQ